MATSISALPTLGCIGDESVDRMMNLGTDCPLLIYGTYLDACGYIPSSYASFLKLKSLRFYPRFLPLCFACFPQIRLLFPIDT